MFFSRKQAALALFGIIVCVAPFGQIQQTSLETPGTAANNGELVMRSLAAAYPGQILAVEYRKTPQGNRDWALLLRDRWFFYSGGRFLPEELLDRANEYDPQPFYRYTPGPLPEWREPSTEEDERYSTLRERQQENPPKRSSLFFDELWQSHTRDESYDRLKTIIFLGRDVLVHYAILEEIALVEARIYEAASKDAEVQAWIKNLDSITAWSWRSVAETETRSYHAYAVALDLLPVSYGGKETYWLWTADYASRWWAIPYSRRYHPPQAVIDAFEAYGFVWGGKWPNYDTMHFEYRPELFYYSGHTVQTY